MEYLYDPRSKNQSIKLFIFIHSLSSAEYTPGRQQQRRQSRPIYTHIFDVALWVTGSNIQTLSLVQYGLKNWEDFSLYSPFALTSTMIVVFIQEKQPALTCCTTVSVTLSLLLPSKTSPAPQMYPGSLDKQSSSSQPAQKKLKQQK